MNSGIMGNLMESAQIVRNQQLVGMQQQDVPGHQLSVTHVVQVHATGVANLREESKKQWELSSMI